MTPDPSDNPRAAWQKIAAGVLAVTLLAFVLILTARAAGEDVMTTAAAESPPATQAATTTTEAPATTTTIDQAVVTEFLDTWQDTENAAAAEAFAAEQARLEAEAAEQARIAEEARQAEQARQAAAAQAATTTAPPAPPPPPATNYGSGACGGDLPPCYVMMRESGGNITAQNPVSTASGKWQFLDSTWAGYGGYAKARYAPESVQDDRARQLWAGGAGCSHWSAC